MSSIVAEAENLIAQGVREITLIGQDTTCYGEDLGLTDGLAQLLEALAVLPGLRWLRFLYTYPNKVTTRLLETMAKHDTIAKYLDVPLQHASASVLKRMKRGGNAQIFLDLIEKARRIVPGIVIRTSFIVGFPGETEDDYNELEAFVTAAKIDWLGVFTYSDEEGAKAFELDDELKVPKRTIQSRRRKLMKLQQKISAKAKARMGRPRDRPPRRRRVRRDRTPLGGPHHRSTPPRSTARSSSTTSAPTKSSFPEPSTAPRSPSRTTTTSSPASSSKHCGRQG